MPEINVRTVKILSYFTNKKYGKNYTVKARKNKFTNLLKNKVENSPENYG